MSNYKEYDKVTCLDAIKKIKDKLDNLGFDSIIVNNDILCKGLKYQKSSSSCPVGANSSCTCPHTVCIAPHATCPNNIKNTGNVGPLITSVSDSDTLFRVRPSDIYNGINLHVIKLRGEISEFKMLFNNQTEGIAQIIQVIQFLSR